MPQGKIAKENFTGGQTWITQHQELISHLHKHHFLSFLSKQEKKVLKLDCWGKYLIMESFQP